MTIELIPLEEPKDIQEIPNIPSDIQDIQDIQDIPVDIAADIQEIPKRGRGRPAGSKNKAKPAEPLPPRPRAPRPARPLSPPPPESESEPEPAPPSPPSQRLGAIQAHSQRQMEAKRARTDHYTKLWDRRLGY